MKLYLKKSDYTTILEHCTAGLPNESCGLLAGTREDEEITVTKVYLLTNVDASREHFSMDPKEQLKAIEYLILSLMEEGNPVLKAFGIDKEKNVTIHEIEITE